MKRLAWFVLAFTLATGSAAARGHASSTGNRFVHANGRYLVDSEGHTLQLRGINLGNWLVPEGYMFGLEGGPVSPREIGTYFNELLGPAEAANFWQAYREAYIT
jgi:hypothetical protein